MSNPTRNYAIEWILRRAGFSASQIAAAAAAVIAATPAEDATGSLEGDVVGELLGPLAVVGIHGDEMTDVLVADADDYDPEARNALVWRLDLAGFGLTGIAAPETPGEWHVIVALTAGTLSDADASSAAANRIVTGTGADLALGVDGSALVVYDGASERWRVLGAPAAGSSSSSSGLCFSPLDYGAAQDGVTDDTLALQAAIDAAAAVAGTVCLGPGSYLFSAEASGQRYGITVPTRVTLAGDGKYLSTLIFDPAQTLPAGDIFIPIEIGQASAGATNVTVRDLGLIANMSVLGDALGPYIEGIAARQDGDETEHCDDVTIDRVYVQDANTSIYCCKDGGLSGAAKIADQHRRWVVRDSVVEDAANKAIEMQQVDGFIVTGNVGINCVDGLQAINYSRHGVIAGNVVEYMAAGLSVTEGLEDVVYYGNVLDCIGGAGTFVGGVIIRREPFTGSVTSKRVTIAHNIIRDWTSSEKIGLLFASFTPNTGVGTFEDYLIVGNTFDAETNYLYDPYFPAKTAASRLRIFDNYFANVVNSSSAWSSAGTRLERNYIGANFTMASASWHLRGNDYGGTFTLTGTGCTLDDGYVRNVLVSTTPPSSGQVLTATSGTAAAWATPSSGPAFATPAIVLGTAASAGAASTVIRSDATIVAFDATAPTTQAFGDAAATGTATVAARRDHKHGFPAVAAPTVHDEPVTDGASNFIFYGGDVIVAVGIPNP